MLQWSLLGTFLTRTDWRDQKIANEQKKSHEDELAFKARYVAGVSE